MYCETSGADQIQYVTTGVGGEVDMLSEVEALEEVQELSGRFAVVVVNVEIKITEEENGRRDGT